jgi:hypothetical protein
LDHAVATASDSNYLIADLRGATAVAGLQTSGAELLDDPARQSRDIACRVLLDRCDNAQLECNSRSTTSLAVSMTEVRPTGSRVLGLSGRCLFEPGA